MVDIVKKTNVLAPLLSVIIAILGLLGYIPELRLLGSVHSGFIPMAPSTAVCFLLQSVILLRLVYQRRREPEGSIMRVLSGFTALYGLLGFLGYFMGLDLNFEHRLVPTMGHLGGIPIGRMSPLTGMLFFLTGIGVFFVIPKSHSAENHSMYGAGVLGGLVIILSFIAILSYLMGMPFLYERGATVPMALTTAFGFFCVGAAIIAAAGKNSLSLRIFAGHSTRARLMRVFLPLVVVAVLIESIASRYIPAFFAVHPVFITTITIVVSLVITGLMINWASTSLGLAIDQAEQKRKKTEEGLRESENNFRNLVENSLIGISIIQDNRIIYQNQEQEKLLGPLPRLIKLTDNESIHPDDIEKVEAFYKNIVSGKVQVGDLNFRFYVMDDSGIRGDLKWAHCRTNRIEYHGKGAILMNIMDMTQTKKLERLLSKQDKMASLGRIATGIAHEIRNPLSGINIYLTTLKKLHHKDGTEDTVEKILKQLQFASNKIESVIRRVMDFARPGEMKLTLIDINEPITEAINLASVTMRKSGIKIETFLKSDLPQAWADKNLIETVVLNLINNAAEAMKTIVTDKKIVVASFVQDDSINIQVSDSGPGVPEEIRDKILDPYFTTKQEGTGIGLSLCHRIIMDHSGSIDVYQGKWGGAEFRIEIPISRHIP